MTVDDRAANDALQYTANLVDTGVFRALGKPSNKHYDKLKTAISSVGVTLCIPATIYRELGGDIAGEEFPSGSGYVDQAIRDGWVTVADCLPGNRTDEYEDLDSSVEKSRHDGHRVIAELTNHPQTVNQWDDTALIGLAVRLFEQNERIRILVHTTDRALAKAARVVVPEYGYYDIKTRYYPPRTVKARFPEKTSFNW
jgi:hypothetical protein